MKIDDGEKSPLCCTLPTIGLKTRKAKSLNCDFTHGESFNKQENFVEQNQGHSYWNNRPLVELIANFKSNMVESPKGDC